MKARICLDGTMLEEIEVQNGLRQGCCAPVLFNLYTSLAVGKWLVRVEDTERLPSSTSMTSSCLGSIAGTHVRGS